MAIDYSVRRPTRRCAASDRPLAPGEAFVSVLLETKGEVVRHDYAAEAWNGPPEDAIGWWRCRTPEDTRGKPAPREVLLGLIDEWADEPQHAAARYLLALLLVRRRVLQNTAGSFLSGFRGQDDQPRPGVLRLACRDREEPIEVQVVAPTADEAGRIQQRLNELLGAA